MPELPPETRAQLASLLAGAPAFTGVATSELEQLVLESRTAYVAEPVAAAGEYETFVVQSGAVFVREPGTGSETADTGASGEVVDLVGPGEFAAVAPTARLEPVDPALLLLLPHRARTLAWSAPASELRRLIRGHLRRAEDLEHATVAAVMSAPVHTIEDDASCREAARRMRAQNISALVVTGRDPPGIVTDRDLRNRLVAEALPAGTPVHRIASRPLRTVDASAPVVEAAAQMLAAAVHHLVVVEGGAIVGMVTAGDVLRLRQSHPLLLRNAIESAPGVAALAEVLSAVPAGVEALLAAGVGAHVVGRILAAVTDRVTVRLLDLAAADIGAPPSDFGWVALGSHGRREQTLFSDQDHALLLPDGLDGEAAAHFGALAARVVDGLERCGYPRCPGGVMASSGSWRADGTTWRRRVDDWVTRPSSEHLLVSAIAFDQRTVAGGIDVRDTLGPLIRRAAGDEVFLARLAREALRERAPLGFLGRFLVDRGREWAGTLDLKRSIMTPIASIARVHAIAGATGELETHARLDAAVRDGRLSGPLAGALAEGYELAMHLRLDAHVRQHRQGRPSSNAVDPGELPALARAQLKETFRALRTAQDALAGRYLVDLLG